MTLRSHMLFSSYFCLSEVMAIVKVRRKQFTTKFFERKEERGRERRKGGG